MSAHVDITCGACGIEFCIPERRYQALRESHETFYCPNGHPRAFLGKTEQEKLIERLKRVRDDGWERAAETADELEVARNEFVGALKECPMPDCDFRARSRIPRDPVAMGRGIERVQREIVEHLCADHGARPNRTAGLLPERTGTAAS